MNKSQLQVIIGETADTATIKNNKYTYFYKRPLGHRKHTLVLRDNASREEAVLHGNAIRGLKNILNSESMEVQRDYSCASIDYYNGTRNKQASDLFILTEDTDTMAFDGRQINSIKRVLEAI